MRNPFATLMLTVCVLAFAAAAGLAQLPLGERSEDVNFAYFENGGTLANARLSDFEGKVVAIVYFTPW